VPTLSTAILILGLFVMALRCPAAEAVVRRDAVVKAVEEALPAVVNIATLTIERADPYEAMLREFFGYGRRTPDTAYSSGSGVIIDEEGWVLTNLHVVRNAARVWVTLAEIREPIDAEVFAVSESSDLALLRLKPQPGQKFRSVVFSADDDLFLGETVTALGNPYGLGGSVSRGILSSKTRRPERDGEAMAVEDWLQTDASINPGNSGGPLINLEGELIGLNVAILANAQGIGFAIPVKRINAALAEMLSPEATRGMWFGASVHGMRPPLIVSAVQPGGPAENAGLQRGDHVLSINGVALRSCIQFYRELGDSEPDVRLVVQRDSRRRQIQVRMLPERDVFNLDYLRRRMGMTLEPVPEEIQRELRINLSGALRVRAVEDGGPADDAGIVRNQFLTAVEGQPPANVVALGRSLNRRGSGDRVVLDLLSVRRRGAFLQFSRPQIELRLR
jgi:S1-C subfamily serine protease